MASDNDARIGYGRRSASSSSSKESSPAARRQKRSFSPNSDDGDHVVPAPVQDDAGAPPRDGTPVPLIRQAVGFSWQPSVLPTATVNTYQAVLPTNPNAIQFLPGQAPPKKKRKRAKPEYSAQTSRFRLVADSAQASTSEPLTQPALYAGSGPYSSMYRVTSAAPSASAIMSNPSVVNAASPAAEAYSPSASSTLVSTPRSSYNAAPGTYNNIAAGPSRDRAPGQVGAPATNTKNKRSKKSTGQRSGSSAQASVPSPQLQQQQSSTTHHQGMQPPHYRRDYENTIGSYERSMAPAVPVRPLRMLTILIEDVRSGVPDHQLAEVQVHLRPGEDPDGNLWANAKEICEKLQAGPSRIDGPARVYTLRGKYRQFFMRVDADNVLEAEPCNLGVSKERTLEVVVEAPPPKGQIPLPPRIPRDLQPASSSDSDMAPSTSQQQSSKQAMYSDAVREPCPDPLSQSDHRSQKRKRHSKNHSSIHREVLRSPFQESPSPSHTPNRARQSGHADRESSSSSDEDEIRESSPPVLGRLADTVDDRDDAVAKFIRSDIESDEGWPRCMSIISRGGSKRISDMLWCYDFIERKAKECKDKQTPPHWDGAPNCWVERRHICRVLNVPPAWGEECRTVLKFVAYYGKPGRRYQYPSVIKELDNTDPPTEKTWRRFVKLLHDVDDEWEMSKHM
ncbi:hypothetical protein AZE42_03327 [Rhizopogon vesiculosus]|uniref:Uncharacterized protein n=1 Tax=Rhizopogon vesiculosus TaxID=180088 RepID=A0A1J8QD00_9AGAM|nr:hypothetical protein AZE42_03327 [Rhizopogon vesiculosus]